MKEEFTKYLTSIGISGVILTKIEEVSLFYTNILGYKIEDIFVSEYLNSDGSRIYENLWFFNNEICGEAKLFLNNDDFDCEKLIQSIYYFNIKKNDWDMVQDAVTEKSRMYLTFSFANSILVGEMKASKENCLKLRDIFLKYIFTNFIGKK